ncbi:MAG: circularly permuted type 2 ATP-grasp protein, partial [Myxococcaceae bacterium]
MLSDYRALPGAFDELLGATDKMRATVEAMVGSGSAEQFARTQALAEAALLNQGVTFSVYSDARGVEKIFPVCLLPRVISASEWDSLERGLQQRVRALEAFVEDVYADQRILAEGAIPPEVVLGSAQYLPAIR